MPGSHCPLCPPPMEPESTVTIGGVEFDATEFSAAELEVVTLCNERKDGATCKRPKDHTGMHCSIPELMALHPGAAAQVEAELKNPACRTHAVTVDFLQEQMGVALDRVKDGTISIAMVRTLLKMIVDEGQTVEYLISLRG